MGSRGGEGRGREEREEGGERGEREDRKGRSKHTPDPSHLRVFRQQDGLLPNGARRASEERQHV